VRVNERQFAKVNALYEEALEILDISSRPELYISQSPIANAFAYGVEQPFIVLNSSIVSLLEPKELQTVIAHELGHIVAGHMLYVSVLHVLVRLLNMGGLGIPFGTLGLRAFLVALFEWYRKAELTCDRAGLLVAQDIDVCHRTEMKLAGGKHIEEMALQEFFVQAEEYDKHGDILDSVYKLLNNWDATHPHAVARILELQRWYDHGNYREILAGNYTKREEEVHVRTTKTWQEAFDSMRNDLKQSGDPLSKLASDLADIGGSFISAGGDLFGKIFGSDKKK
jgi:Zn-dependent protease with chaperone function